MKEVKQRQTKNKQAARKRAARLRIDIAFVRHILLCPRLMLTLMPSITIIPVAIISHVCSMKYQTNNSISLRKITNHNLSTSFLIPLYFVKNNKLPRSWRCLALLWRWCLFSFHSIWIVVTPMAPAMARVFSPDWLCHKNVAYILRQLRSQIDAGE